MDLPFTTGLPPGVEGHTTSPTFRASANPVTEESTTTPSQTGEIGCPDCQRWRERYNLVAYLYSSLLEQLIPKENDSC